MIHFGYCGESLQHINTTFDQTVPPTGHSDLQLQLSWREYSRDLCLSALEGRLPLPGATYPFCPYWGLGVLCLCEVVVILEEGCELGHLYIGESPYLA